MGEVSVRVAVVGDAAAIAAAHVAAWRAAYAGLIDQPTLDALSVAEFTARREQHLQSPRPNGCHLVAEADGAIVGFAVVGPSRDDDADTTAVGEIYAMYALPSAWGTGAGRALMLASLAFLRECGFSTAMLWVLEGNARGRRFYQAAGLIADGATKSLKIGESEHTALRYRMAL